MNEPAESSSPAVRAVEELVRRAEAAGASDVHFQIQAGDAAVSFRLDGQMVAQPAVDGDLARQRAGRLKFLAKLKTYQESLPQDGRIERADVGSRQDIRIATYPAVVGERIVLRLFQEGAGAALDELGLDAVTFSALDGFLRQPSGLLLLTGPAGSGKTTTIYACLQRLVAAGGRHVITIEDPVERVLPGVMQTEISEARGLGFATAARHLLRQDPQVIVIGEIRDDETAGIAIRAGLTGHLVISTLHAGSCRGVLERLLAMCRDRSAVATALSLIVNQRLVRKSCDACAGKGCASCSGTGYRGRVPLSEILRVDDPKRRRWLEGGVLEANPVRTLAEAAEALVKEGVTTRAEVARVMGSVMRGS